MSTDSSESDATRAAIVDRALLAVASGHLTTDVAMALPFEALGPFKEYLKRFFSTEPWTDADAFALSDLVAPYLADGIFEHQLDDQITLTHGLAAGTYLLTVAGVATGEESIFDRVFSSPVTPEATPHPRKVKFSTGGAASPGRWFRRSDPDPPDHPGVARLLEEADVTDVMVAGDFVTVGINARSSWEDRLEPLLELVTTLFWRGDAATGPTRTREELMQEAGDLGASRVDQLNLLDPNNSAHRARLHDAFADPDPRVRRVAVAILAESSDAEVRHQAVEQGVEDPSRVVRRTAVDAAADTEDEALRGLFETATESDDEWIRWRAVRAIRTIGAAPSRAWLDSLADDPDFQVRLEVATTLRTLDS